jgi:hypothetical protein
MHECPHCRQQSFTGLQKWWASSFFPATCRHCGGVSHVIAARAGGIAAATWLALAVTSMVALQYQSYAIGAVGVIAAVALYLALWRRVPLSARTARQLKVSRRFVWLYLLAEAVTS